MDADRVRHEWATREGEFSPTYYAYRGPNEVSELIRDRLAAVLDDGDPILEVGCSAGRHLAHLHDDGFNDLVGVDVNPEMLEVMAATYPELAATGRFHAAAIEDVITEFPTDGFRAVYSVETLQHLHPDADWVFDEIARVTADVLIVAEIEDWGGDGSPVESTATGDVPIYRRDWGDVFTELGFEERETVTVGHDTVHVFRRGTAT